MQKITEKLHLDHEKVAKLLKDLQQASPGAQKARESLCQKLVTEVQIHATFEEEVFYPAVRAANGGTDGEVESALEEHQEVEQMLSELQSLDVNSDEFMDLVGEIEEAIQKHVQHEEEDIFPLATRGIEDQESEQMSRKHDEMAQEHRVQQ